MPAAAFIHDTAIVDAGASVGPDTKVWHHSHVRTGARIGAGCTIGKNVYVDAGVQIGDRVKIQNNVSVYAGVVIEDEVFVGPSAVFTNDRVPRAGSAEWQMVPTYVRTGASVGANATVVCGVELGPCCLVGAGAVVTRSVLAHEIVVGNAARRIGWVCACGATTVRASAGEPAELHCDACETDLVVEP
jgi:UDP-3-O-[3-hydroxymyristoyl] glucosamine N-acyltransferase